MHVCAFAHLLSWPALRDLSEGLSTSHQLRLRVLSPLLLSGCHCSMEGQPRGHVAASETGLCFDGLLSLYLRTAYYVSYGLPLWFSWCPRGERPLVALYLEPGVFSERCTEKLPLCVDFIHRVEFGEVSGHRVLIKRGPGNRGPSECGTTHEATSGMSS